MALNSSAQNQNTLIRKGNQEYKKSRFDEALPLYQKALKLNRNNPVAWYNSGDALFRNKQWAEAEKSFDRVAEPGNDPVLQQKAIYNKGVSLSRQNKLEESIISYKKAVILNPTDEDARVNLQKALLELKKKNPPPPEKEKENKEQKKNNQKKDQQPPPTQSKLTKKQVEQLLKALEQREQQAQQKMQQNRSRSNTRPDKDW